MTKEKLDKIIKAVKNGGVIIADNYRHYNVITENMNIQDIFNYDERFYHFYIKDDNKPLCELEEII